jgi:tRNA threonylcarbamoyl adenosine modification protein (Sua5/YciO/YrdC/YwlC family)
MTEFIRIHPQNPQHRLITQIATKIKKGAVAVLPTDSCYALACFLENKKAADKIRVIRQTDKDHKFTLICQNLSQIAEFAKISNKNYRLIKNNTPNSFTFITKATSQVPRRLMHPKRKNIGIRIPDNNILQKLILTLDSPIMSCSFILAGKSINDIDSIPHNILQNIDLIVDGGECPNQPTTVVHLEDEKIRISRQSFALLQQ